MLIQEALRESETKAKALLNATTDIAVLLDRDGIIHAANEAAEEDLGKSVKEMVFPYIEKMKQSSLDPNLRTLLEIIDSNFNDISTPFMQGFPASFRSCRLLKFKWPIS